MAITTTNIEPHVWSQGYNPIVYSITSDQNTQTDFSYIFWVYVNGDGSGEPDFKIIQRPNPAGAGMIDISSFIQPYIELSNFAQENSYNNTWYATGANFVPNILIYAGEQYSIGGVITSFNGSGTVGDPAFLLTSRESSAKQVRVLPAALPWQESIDIMANNTNYYYWSNYVMDGNGKFLKEQGNSISVFDYDYSSLAFLNWWDTSVGSYDPAVQLLQYKQYSANGTLLRTDNVQNTTAAGGGPQTTSAYTTQTFNQAYTLLYAKTGPQNLKDSSLWDNLTAYYTVQAFAKASATSSASPGTPVSELVTYTISDECLQMYPRIRVSWLNSLGGRDYWNFTKFFEKTTNSPDTKYFQTPLNWSSALPVATSGNKTENWIRGGNKSFNKNVTQTFSVQTDWLLQDDVDLLAGIAESPQVWIYIGTDITPYTVNVSNVNYTYKNVEQTKLVQASYDLTYTKVQQKQNM
jgi:hypothetical protein